MWLYFGFYGEQTPYRVRFAAPELKHWSFNSPITAPAKDQWGLSSATGEVKSMLPYSQHTMYLGAL